MHPFRLICFLILGATIGWPFFVSAASTFAEGQLRALSADKHWLRLLHYQTNFLGFTESQADGENFFLSGNKRDPHLELVATLNGFLKPQDDKDLDDHPQCRFPARKEWLVKRLNLKLPNVKCPAFEKYFERIKPKSVVLIFSSYYTGSPSSLFGHTFIRINQKTAGEDSPNYDLTNFGYNYAANKDTDNPIMYAYKGVFGGFRGTFSLMPFYYKVREYSDFESRDLWEYELNFSEEETAFLVKHLWEVGDTWFNYTYFFENCSWHMLTAIEAIRPDVEYVKHLQFTTIPGDTIRALNHQPQFLRKVNFRPSAQRRFFARLNQLNPSEIRELKNRVETLSVEKLSEDSSARGRMLDATIDYIDYKYASELMPQASNVYTKFKHQLLRERSKVTGYDSSLSIGMPVNEDPRRAHASDRWRVAASDQEKFVLGYRFALHDLLDPTPGYPHGIGLVMFSSEFKTDFENSFRLSEFSLFDLMALKPFNGFENDASWTAKFGMWRVKDQTCYECLAVSAQAGVGLNYRAGSFDFYGLLITDLHYSPEYLGRELNLNSGPRIGVLANLTSRLRFNVFGERKYFAGRPYEFEDFFTGELHQDISKHFGLRLSYTSNATENEATFSLLYYP